MTKYANSLIFGKNQTERLVSIEIVGKDIVLFIENGDKIETKTIPNEYWLLTKRELDPFNSKTLAGNLPFKYLNTYKNKRDWMSERMKYKSSSFSIYDEKEAAMVMNGLTSFKGMKIEEVSILSFDIETTGVVHNDQSKVLIVSNTLRKNGKITRKMFCYDEYENERQLFDAWCAWVVEVNPSIVCGHNIISYDLPYIAYCAARCGAKLELGRDLSGLWFEKYESQFRKDGSQSYTYHKAHIFGRSIIDTFFLAIKFDIGRKYISYGLKQIIEQEGLQVKNRQFYDAGKIKDNYKNEEEFEKIKKYAEFDADDSLALFDLMAPALFYFTQTIPKPFQNMLLSATGSQLNSFLIRSYLQDGHSLPESSPAEPYEGAISIGVPGIYTNCFKIDFAALYPNIIRQYEVYDLEKDPKQNFLKMVEYFLEERLVNKQLAKDTGDRYYSDLEQSQKVGANSAYGLLGATGILFNSPVNASKITRIARDLLNKTILWATNRDADYWMRRSKDE